MVVSLLPFPLLYLLSDLVFFLIYHIIGYRKKVVYYNLKLSFPEKQEHEIHAISKKFYKHLADLILESIKSFTISKKQILKRVHAPIRLDEELKNKQSVIYLLGHYGNWEWINLAGCLQDGHQIHTVYHQLSNPYFDKLFIKSRSRFGAKLSEMKKVARNLVQLRNETIATTLVADQNPKPEQAIWVDFLNRKTAFFAGPSRIAEKFGHQVYYINIKKLKRGYYEAIPTKLNHDQKNIVQSYAIQLEKNIKQAPEYWLWSHRRWKHKYEDFNEI